MSPALTAMFLREARASTAPIIVVSGGGVLDFSDPNNSALLAALTGDQFGGTDAVPAGGALDFSDPAQSGNAALLFGDEAP
ncbi:MAG: hypothetical protein ACRYG4_17195 [Janthinobacterium lividum]